MLVSWRERGCVGAVDVRCGRSVRVRGGAAVEGIDGCRRGSEGVGVRVVYDCNNGRRFARDGIGRVGGGEGRVWRLEF